MTKYDIWDWFCIFRWRWRVCWIGLKWHRVWVWNHIDMSEWYEMREWGDTPKDAYIEGWCRD